MITKEQKQQLLDMIFDAKLEDIDVRYHESLRIMGIFVQNISIFHFNTTHKNLGYPLPFENSENSEG